MFGHHHRDSSTFNCSSHYQCRTYWALGHLVALWKFEANLWNIEATEKKLYIISSNNLVLYRYNKKPPKISSLNGVHKILNTYLRRHLIKESPTYDPYLSLLFLFLICDLFLYLYICGCWKLPYIVPFFSQMLIIFLFIFFPMHTMPTSRKVISEYTISLKSTEE